MDMPAVNECQVEACAYNRNHACNALAITVGNSRHAECETFLNAPSRGGDPEAVGRVGACKMAGCSYNKQLECQAPGIVVGMKQQDVDCLTYAPA